ncbi:MAG: hypothetical protein RR331_00520 [Bacteroides sp.]
MKSIGGYFELEIRRGVHYHENAIRLCTARNCFEYILLARQYLKVYIPRYTCSVMLEPLKKNKIEYEFYSLDTFLNPVFEKKIDKKEAFLYTNYFGLKQQTVIDLANNIHNLIIDNAQAFFASPVKGIDTFYSARKFFGVPDGAYLYTNVFLLENFPVFNPLNSCRYLLGRMTNTAEEYFSAFQKSESFFVDLPIHKMSVISERILSSLDYPSIAYKRQFNYNLMYYSLNKFNVFHFDISDFCSSVPMVYPFFTDNNLLREQLLLKHIYVPQYWPNVQNWSSESEFEFKLSQCLIPLPIDQRYGAEEMNFISKEIMNNIKRI